jgi:hypothetical protein
MLLDAVRVSWFILRTITASIGGNSSASALAETPRATQKSNAALMSQSVTALSEMRICPPKRTLTCLLAVI